MSKREYVYLSRPTRVFCPQGGGPIKLEWLRITDKVRDPVIHNARPGRYAIHPTASPERVYILAEHADRSG